LFLDWGYNLGGLTVHLSVCSTVGVTVLLSWLFFWFLCFGGSLCSFTGLLCFFRLSRFLISYGFFLSPVSISISAAYLSFVISSEAIDSAIFGSGDAVVLSSCQLDDIVSLEWIQAVNSGWYT